MNNRRRTKSRMIQAIDVPLFTGTIVKAKSNHRKAGKTIQIRHTRISNRIS